MTATAPPPHARLFRAAPAAPPAGRLPGFERVRAAAMLAVVAFHAALPYARGELPGLLWAVPVTGENPGAVADPLFWAAEAVIMPVFFALSGYFSGRLADRQDAAAFVAGRVRRVAVPLVVGCATIVGLSLAVWLVSFPLTGRASWGEALKMRPPEGVNDLLWGTAHLWYLEYLFLWALLQVPLDATLAAADRGENRTAARLLGPLDRAVSSPWRWAVLAGGVTVVLAANPEVYLGFQHGWFPSTPKFLHAGVCFLFGRFAWRRRESLAASGRQVWPLTVAAAASVVPVVWAARGAVGGNFSDRMLAVPVGLCAGLTVTAALVHGATSTKPAGRVVRRLAGASFWVYLVHQPLIGAAQLGLWFVGWPADAEFALAFAAALSLSLLAEPLATRTAWGRLVTGQGPKRVEPPRESVPLQRAA